MSGDALVLLAASALAMLSGAGLLLASALREERLAAQRARRFEEVVTGRVASSAARSLRGAIHQLGGRYGRLLARLSPDDELAGLLVGAGFRGRDALASFLAVQLLAPLFTVLLVALAWLLGTHPRSVPFPVATFTGFALAYLAPKQFLRRTAAIRAGRLRGELPSAVHLLRVLFESGLSTQQALKLVASERRTPVPTVASEFAEVLRLTAAGSSFADATREVGGQSPVPDLADLLALLRQVDRHGGAVEAPLSSYATLLEDRRRTALQETVGRLSAKMTVVMVVCLFPALLVFLAGPGFLAMIRTLRNVHG